MVIASNVLEKGTRVKCLLHRREAIITMLADRAVLVTPLLGLRVLATSDRATLVLWMLLGQ
jgi:hypothetical protein